MLQLFLENPSEISAAGDAEMAQLNCQICEMVPWVAGALHPELLYQGSWVLHFPPSCQHRLDKLEAKAEHEAVMEVVRHQWALEYTWSASRAALDGPHAPPGRLPSPMASGAPTLTQANARCQLSESTLWDAPINTKCAPPTPKEQTETLSSQMGDCVAS